MLGKAGYDNKKLLQTLILSMVEDNGMTVQEVIKLLVITAMEINQALLKESLLKEAHKMGVTAC